MCMLFCLENTYSVVMDTQNTTILQLVGVIVVRLGMLLISNVAEFRLLLIVNHLQFVMKALTLNASVNEKLNVFSYVGIIGTNINPLDQ